MSGGGGNTTTTSNVSEPWKEAQPYIKDVLKGAQTAYQSGEGFKPYPDSTVVPFSGQTQNALGQIESLAGAGNPLGIGAQNAALGVFADGGIGDWARTALGGAHDVATGARSINTEGGLQGLLAQAGLPGAIAQNLGGYASGANVTGGSPEFKAALNYQAGQLGDDINRGFSNMGRYGSGAHFNELGDQVGRFRNDALASQIAREQGNQIQAAGMLSGEQQQGFGNQLGVLGQIGQTQGANIANMVNAGQGIQGAQQQGYNQMAQFAGLAPSIYNQQYAPAERLASVGAQYEDLSTRTLQDQIEKFNANQQSPWNLLSAYNALIGGSGQLGQTATSTVRPPTNYGAPLGGALGGAQIGSAFGPWGAGAGAIGGGLLGLLGM